jgi:hypothetical protein
VAPGQYPFQAIGVPSLFPAFAVGLDVRRELGKRAEADCDKHAVAEPPDRRKGSVIKYWLFIDHFFQWNASHTPAP